MTLLILGGTAEARALTLYLHQRRESLITDAIYSVVGLVRVPELPCTVVAGGFSQFGGLQTFLQHRQVSGVVDVTHPYAAHMTRTAQAVTQRLKLPYWRFQRPKWLPGEGDQWIRFQHWSDVLSALHYYRSVLFTVGQLSEASLARLRLLHKNQGQKHCVRTAVRSLHSIPQHIVWQAELGPFSVEEEMALLQRHDIDVLVSKNSGGSMTKAKLTAACNLNVPVLMLQRPDDSGMFESLDQSAFFDQLHCCADAILEHYFTRSF